MYIKKVYKKNPGSNKRYTYCHLVDMVRTAKGPRQRLILNLGKPDLPEELWPDLASRLEELLAGQERLLAADPEVERLAQLSKLRILRKRIKDTPSEKDYALVDLNQLSASECRTIGPEYVGYKYWQKLALKDLLKDKGFTEKEIKIASLLILARLIHPGSELSTLYFLKKLSALGELMGYDSSYLTKDLLYRVGDKIYQHKEDLEAHLSKVEAHLFHLEEKIILYDLTNTYLEGRALANPKAQFGRSKEQRKDCKLLALGLVIDSQGFPKGSQFFAGSISEPTTLKEMVETMLAYRSNKDQDPLIVLDGGLGTKENISFLKDKKLPYLTVWRGKHPPEIDLKAPLKVIKEDEKREVKIEVRGYPQEEEVYLLCKSKQKELKEKSIQGRLEKIVLEHLAKLQKSIAAGRLKKRDKIHQRIGRLRERYSKVAQYYDMELQEEEGQLKLSYTRREDIQERPSGTYLLRTNRQDLSEEEIWELYSMLTQVEDSFHSLKSHLGMRPIYHQREGRAEAHIFLSLLAYHLLHSIEAVLRAKGDHRTWKTIKEALSSQARVTVSLAAQNGLGYHIRVCTIPEKEHLEIYQTLHLDPIPLPRRRATFRL